MFSIAGGIFLIIGAFYTYRGDIFKSVGFYLIADLCWISIAYNNGDYIGVGFIIVGVTFGLIAFSKMQRGSFHKKIKGKR